MAARYQKGFVKSHPLEYESWRAMRSRCGRAEGYEDVTVCERWSRFDAFVEDMGRRPGTEYSLDRLDPFGNYEPDNCRWATFEDQAQNRRESVPLMDKINPRHYPPIELVPSRYSTGGMEIVGVSWVWFNPPW